MNKMNKKDKIKLLLGQLEAIEKKSGDVISPANEDLDSLITRTINEETSKISARLNDNDTVKILKRINQDLNKIRKELDLKPIAESISSIKDSIGQQDEENSSKFKSVDKSVKSIQGDVDSYYGRITEKLLRVEESISLLSKKDDSKGEITSINKEIKDFKKSHSSIQDSIKDIVSDISGVKKSKDSIRSDMAELDKKITDLIDDTSVKLGNIQRFGGGNANRRISVNGTVISTRYTDINFKGSGVTYAAVDNDATRQVDFTLTSSGGSGYQAVSSGVVDGSNAIFEWATAPNSIVVDQGRVMQKTSSDGTVNWTGTTTTTLTVAPNFDIFAVA